jgi:hypothetical protein
VLAGRVRHGGDEPGDDLQFVAGEAALVGAEQPDLQAPAGDWPGCGWPHLNAYTDSMTQRARKSCREPQRARNRVRCRRSGTRPVIAVAARTAAVMRACAAVDRYGALNRQSRS